MPDRRISTGLPPQALHLPIGWSPSFVNSRRGEDVPVEAAKLERVRAYRSRVGLRPRTGSGAYYNLRSCGYPQPDGRRLFPRRATKF